MDRISLSNTPPTDQTSMPTAQAKPGTFPSTQAFATTLSHTTERSMKKNTFLPFVLLIVFLGVGTGFVAARMTATPGSSVTQQPSEGGENLIEENAQVKVGQVVGAPDGSKFKDNAEGVLVSGGVDGEGSHHLVRPGGISQNVYLTSSVMDLKAYENHKVNVSGETFQAQKAGWLMDVVRLEVIELNAPLPDGAK